MTDPGRFAMFVVWGLGCFAMFTIALVRSYRQFRKHRDARAQRDLLEALALWIVSVAAAAAVTLVLFGPVGTGIRQFSVALALGAFAAVGLIKATEKEPR